MRPLARLALCALVACEAPVQRDLSVYAPELARKTLIVDGHVDLPYRLNESPADVTRRTSSGDFDYVRAREGGLDAPFLSIYVPVEYEGHGAKAYADGLIDGVETLARSAPDKFVLATSAKHVRDAFWQQKVALLMGMENGSPIEGDLANVDHFFERGIRYITLCHAEDNHICDSSYDDRRTNGGLSEFGVQVIRRMNEVGILVDVSHVSDETFWDVMEVTEVPVIASHSSLRHFTPGFERNLSDEMVVRLARNGGVVMINFGSAFLTAECNEAHAERREAIEALVAESGLEDGDPAARELAERYEAEHPVPCADVTDVADHIDRVVQLVGIDYVGLGSDFEGVGDSLPTGLKDVSQYPNLVAELLRRGYSDRDVERVCSGNILRVMVVVERIAGELSRDQKRR